MSMFFNSFATDAGLGLFVPDSGGSSNPLDWNNIINQGFAVGSQIIGAFGRNPSTQVAYNPAQNSIFAIGDAGGGGYQGGYGNMTPAQLQQLQAAQTGVGGTVGSGVDGIFNWMLKNPLPVFGGVAALYLLMREPPRRR